ncbi:PDZ domain-containing protein, partial [bacterium]|nr:PDZ domain-containing protein [bacterium]
MKKILKKVSIILTIIAILILTIWITPCFSSENSDYSLSKAELLPTVLNYIKEDYLDPNRIDPEEMFKSALDYVQSNVPEIMVTYSGDNYTVIIDRAIKKFPDKKLKHLGDLLSELKKVLSYIDLNYRGSKEKNEIEYYVIDGILSTLDPHSNHLPPEIYNEFKVGTKGHFGGLGIVIGMRDGILTVIAPLEGTPASRAGMKAKDEILQIDDESTIGMTLTEAVNLMRGKVGTKVTLTISREKFTEPITKVITRAVIEIDSVQSTIIESVPDKKIGYISINHFQENTPEEFTKALKKLHTKAKKIDGLILDLRDNPGGLLKQCTYIANNFLDNGIIVSTVMSNNKLIDKSIAYPKNTEPNYPVVVLVNDGSASASEIVAGALQHLDRSVVIGQNTFGKGSVQTLLRLKDNSAIKLTIARYLAGGEVSIQSVGLAPDILLMPATVQKDKIDLIQDQSRREEDLDKHLGKDLKLSNFDKSAYKIRHFQIPENEDEDDVSKYTKKLNFDDDYAVNIATNILSKATGWKRQEILGNIAPLIKEEQSKQDDKIAEELKKLNIDWNYGKAMGSSTIGFKVNIIQENKIVKIAKAGLDTTIEIEATNTGKADFYRLIGNSEADDKLFADKEFIFGHLAAGATGKARATFKIPESYVNKVGIFDLKFSEHFGNEPKVQSFSIPLAPRPMPKFAYKYKLAPPMKTIPVGKTINIELEIKNTGTGSTNKAIALIKNESGKGIFIEKGRIDIGELKPGEIKKTTFTFHIEPTFDKKKLKLNFTIYDLTLFASLMDDIEFSTQVGPVSPPDDTWLEGPSISITEGANV